MKLLMVSNWFHGTSATLQADRVSEGVYFINKRQARELRRKLCGLKGCQCSDPIGQRTGGDIGFHIAEGIGPSGNEGYFLQH